MSIHPLAEIVLAAAGGRFPPADGGWQRMPPWRAGLAAVVAFTGHAVIAVGAEVADERLVELGVDGFGGAHHPRLVTALAGPGGWVGSLDVLLVARGSPGLAEPLVPRPDLLGHPRAALAARLREDLRVLGSKDMHERSVLVLGRGLAGLRELSVEVEPDSRGSGAGRELIRAGLAHVLAGEPIVAAVAPGNAASLRALLGSGFVPIGSVQLFVPSPDPGGRAAPDTRAHPI